MMKKTLSLLVLASLGTGVAMASPATTAWVEQQAADYNSNSDCIGTLSDSLKIASYSSTIQGIALQNLNAYESNTRAAINNLSKTGESNAAIYNKFTASMNFWNTNVIGKQVVKCISPFLNFQDLYRQEKVATAKYNKTKSAADYAAIMASRKAQLKLANDSLKVINNLQNVVK